MPPLRLKLPRAEGHAGQEVIVPAANPEVIVHSIASDQREFERASDIGCVIRLAGRHKARRIAVDRAAGVQVRVACSEKIGIMARF